MAFSANNLKLEGRNTAWEWG